MDGPRSTRPPSPDAHVAVIPLALPAPSARVLWDRVSRAWTDAPEPSARFGPEGAAGSRGVLIVLGPGASAQDLLTARDLAAEETRVSLVLTDDAPALRRVCSPDKPVTMPLDTPPAALACALGVLLQRQSLVNSLHAELRVQTTVAAHAAGELMKLHDEIELAAGLQRELLPRTMPELPGVRIAALFRPTGALSGDMYDVQRLDEHHLGVLLADAAGHGVSAALTMMLVSRLLVMKTTHQSGYRLTPPDEALAHLNNRFIDRKGESASLVSAFYGVLDARDGTLRYASAGHPPALLVGPSGERLLDVGGPLLGMMPDVPYPLGHATIAPGDLLLSFSDGFEHAFACPVRGASGQEHMDVFRRLGAGWADEGVERTIERLALEMDAHRGSLHQRDDITLLGIGRDRLAQHRAA